MSRHTSLAFLLIVGLLFIETTHADELISNGATPSSTQPRSFIIDFDSASLETRRAHGVDLDGAGLLEVRDIAAKALPRRRGMVKRSWLIFYDSSVFEPGFFGDSILVELPAGLSCIAHPRSVQESGDGVTTWIGRCESSIASSDTVSFTIFPSQRAISGFIRWGDQRFRFSPTSNNLFHVLYQIDPDFVSTKPVIIR